ncbi:MAG TPA: hypothetical protein VNH42_01200 [Mariprofundaceae bacterium]|nr:hypothetical protein [Mariprofundaceae bacterium]
MRGTLLNTPSTQGQTSLWRVVTRRLVWGQAAKAMQERLQQAGFSPILLQRKEPVEMHAFDDATLYQDYPSAAKAAAAWRKLGFDANVIKAPSAYLVGLGRFFIASYAEQMQERLQRAGRKYRYQRRMVEIPTFRFTFPPESHAEADALWQQIQNLGIADPILMPESRFQQMFGDNANAQAAPSP